MSDTFWFYSQKIIFLQMRLEAQKQAESTNVTSDVTATDECLVEDIVEMDIGAKNNSKRKYDYDLDGSSILDFLRENSNVTTREGMDTLLGNLGISEDQGDRGMVNLDAEHVSQIEALIIPTLRSSFIRRIERLKDSDSTEL